ncbi:MAG: hypothetical protein AAGI92_10610 [Pseudomonadota bacterium]
MTIGIEYRDGESVVITDTRYTDGIDQIDDATRSLNAIISLIGGFPNDLHTVLAGDLCTLLDNIKFEIEQGMAIVREHRKAAEPNAPTFRDTFKPSFEGGSCLSAAPSLDDVVAVSKSVFSISTEELMAMDDAERRTFTAAITYAGKWTRQTASKIQQVNSLRKKDATRP